MVLIMSSATNIVSGQYTSTQSIPSLKIWTDKPNYTLGDTITISGFIDTKYTKYIKQLEIATSDPTGKYIEQNFMPVDSDGRFEYKFQISDRSAQSGQYLIRVWSIPETSIDVGTSFVFSSPYLLAPSNDLVDGNLLYMQTKDLALPGDIMQINGSLLTTAPIKITLTSPNGTIRDTATTFADRDGYFTAELKMPTDAIPGTWTITGQSGNYQRILHVAISYNSVSHTCYGICGRTTWSNLTAEPPIPQWVKNNAGLWALGKDDNSHFIQGLQYLVDNKLIKTQYNSFQVPLWLKHDAYLWYNDQINETDFLNVIQYLVDTNVLIASLGPTYLEPTCDNQYVQGSGIPILFMPTNSTGKICVNYNNPNQSYAAGFEVLEAQNYDKKSDVTISSNPDMIQQGSTTIVYTIHSGKVGFYRMLISCPGMQLAVGYDSNSTFVDNDFPWLGQTFYCPLQSYEFHIEGLSGIGVKHIQHP
jgi:hypothetical protein